MDLGLNSFTRTMRRCTILSYLRASKGRKRAFGNHASFSTGKTMIDSAPRDQD